MSVEISRSVILLGPKTLQNSLLSQFISDTGAISCQMLSALSDIGAKRTGDDILFLADVSVSKDYLDLLNPLRDRARVALINTEDNDDDIYGILQRFDLRGTFLKNTTPELFIRGINAMFSGEYWFSRKLMVALLHRMRQKGVSNGFQTASEPCLSDTLTCKEITILQSLAGGHTNQDIAKRIYLSPHTVKTHIYNIYKKIGVTNRVQAVSWAKKHLNYEF